MRIYKDSKGRFRPKLLIEHIMEAENKLRIAEWKLKNLIEIKERNDNTKQ